MSANATLRQAHGVLQKSMGRDGKHEYRFCQDGREFGRRRDEWVYLEDDSRFSLRYCLCMPGHTLDYWDGPWRYTITLETIHQVHGRFPWRLVDGVGDCPDAQTGSRMPLAGAPPLRH